MSGPAPIKVFTALAEKRALQWASGEMGMQDAVDGLQNLADYCGLVAALGGDAVQDIMAAAFQWAQATVRDENEPEPENDYVRRIIAGWEAEDVNRPRPPAVKQPEYRTPSSVEDAFWIVANRGDPTYLAGWLAQHPLDTAHLHEIWGRKCSTEAA